MDKRAYKQDIVSGIVIVLIGSLAFVLSLDMPGNAPIFPRLVSFILVFLGGLLSLSSMIKMKKGVPAMVQAIELYKLKGPVFVFLLLLLYIFAVIYIGFYISTPIMLIGYMYLLGIRNTKTIVITTVVLMIFIYCLFTMQLGVPLPSGVLI